MKLLFILCMMIVIVGCNLEISFAGFCSVSRICYVKRIVTPKLPSDYDLKVLFEAQELTFLKLRDMILNEPKIQPMDFYEINGKKIGSFIIGRTQVGKFTFNNKEWVLGPGQYCTEEVMLNQVGISRKKYHKYLRMLETINAEWVGIILGRQNSPITFLIKCVDGRCKYIVYYPGIPETVVPDTDKQKCDDSCFSLIKGNWYIERYH